MGISHTGIAYIKDGVLHNIDNPLNAEYLGARGELNSEHYRTLSFIHVVRPRNLTDAQRANLLEWTSRLAASSGRVFPTRIDFNPDYNAPSSGGQSPRFRQAFRPRSPWAEPGRHRRHVLLGVRLVAAVAEGLRPERSR